MQRSAEAQTVCGAGSALTLLLGSVPANTTPGNLARLLALPKSVEEMWRLHSLNATQASSAAGERQHPGKLLRLSLLPRADRAMQGLAALQRCWSTAEPTGGCVFVQDTLQLALVRRHLPAGS